MEHGRNKVSHKTEVLSLNYEDVKESRDEQDEQRFFQSRQYVSLMA